MIESFQKQLVKQSPQKEKEIIMNNQENVLGILCGGGPAPGLNTLISSVTIYACKLNWKVIGFHNGYKYLSTGDPEIIKKYMEIFNEEIVSQISESTGSMLIPDRFNPTKDNSNINNILNMLKYFNVKYLIVVGGNDKIVCTQQIFQGVDPAELSIIAVPKTIDNDIPLPKDQSTFGYHTARSFASKIINNLIEDARSSPRWFIVEMMGKNSGHLTLSVANATGAHLAIIPEDFGDHKVSLKDLCDIIETTIYKRLSSGKNYGLCILCEGLINKMDQNSLDQLSKFGFIQLDSEGEIILDEAELVRFVRIEIERRLNQRRISLKITSKKIGYELRGCNPTSFDAIYCRELGFGAVEGFKNNHSNCIVVWENGKIFYRSFKSLINCENNKILPRLVNVFAESYKIARIYFWQIRPEDISDPIRLKKLADSSNLTTYEFIKFFGHIPSLTVA